MTRIAITSAIAAAVVVLLLQAACWQHAAAECRRRGGELEPGRDGWSPVCVGASR